MGEELETGINRFFNAYDHVSQYDPFYSSKKICGYTNFLYFGLLVGFFHYNLCWVKVTKAPSVAFFIHYVSSWNKLTIN